MDSNLPSDSELIELEIQWIYVQREVNKTRLKGQNRWYAMDQIYYEKYLLFEELNA